jgi:hypothetical protein
MDLVIDRTEVWAASIQDKPGGMAYLLSGLKSAGANLDFVLARRSAENLSDGVLYVTPLRGDAEVAAAAELGFNVTSSVHSVRIQGANKQGVTAGITEILAVEGVNLRGFSMSVSGARFVIYIGLDSADDATKVINILRAYTPEQTENSLYAQAM